jgi:hypothetical protein
MKKAILLVLVLCLMPAVVYAAPQDDLKAFSMEGVGVSLIPSGINIANAVGTEAMKNMETQYDLASSDTDSSHYARLIVYKDTHNLGPALALIDMVDFRPELVAMMSDMGKNLVSKKLEEHGAKLIDWLPVHTLSVKKHNGVLVGARLTLSEKLPIPMFGAIAVYTESGRLTALALMCPDSDRTYWQPVFKQLVTNITLG